LPTPEAGKQKHALRLDRIIEPCAGRTHALRYRCHRTGLAQHPLLQRLLQVQHCAQLILHHASQRYAGPARNDGSNGSTVHLQRHQRRIPLQLLQFGA
jgi:hypothetical protein